MNRRSFIALGVGAVGLAGGAIAWYRLADPRAREIRTIRTRVLDLAAALSFTEQDAPFVRLGYAERVSRFFDDQVVLDLSIGQYVAHETVHRTRLPEGLAGLRLDNRGLKVEFIDIVVDLPENALAPGSARPTATAHLTSKIFFTGDRDYWVQEFRLDLARVDGRWLVHGVTTLRTMER